MQTSTKTRDELLQLCGAINYSLKQIDGGVDHVTLQTLRETMIEVRDALLESAKTAPQHLDILC